MHKIILASGSPRRKEILEKAGIPCQVVVSGAEENLEQQGLSPKMFVQELALIKGQAVAKEFVKSKEITYIISADTVVVLGDKILGKPVSYEDAKKTLTKLSGNTHSVLTGICLWQIGGENSGKAVTACEETKVVFKTLTNEKIEEYLACNEYMDKAGSYGIQEKGGEFVDHIEGDFLNVVGLPLNKLISLFESEFNFKLIIKNIENTFERK